MAFATTFRHSATEPVRGREVDANLDALGVYVDATFLPLTGGTITGNLTVTGNTTLTGTLAINGTWDGWIGANETWTYASATTFTISGDLTGKYQKGDRLKLTQTTAKYFYVTLVAHSGGTTTVTVNGGSDYTLANAAITLPFYSKMDSPQAFPGWFNYSPAWTSTGTAPALVNGTLVGRFSISGRTVNCQIRFVAGSSTTFGTGVYRFSLPVNISTVLTTATDGLMIGTWWGKDEGVANYGGWVGVDSFTAPGTISFAGHSAATNANIATEWGATSVWTVASTDSLGTTVTYEML